MSKALEEGAVGLNAVPKFQEEWFHLARALNPHSHEPLKMVCFTANKLDSAGSDVRREDERSQRGL